MIRPGGTLRYYEHVISEHPVGSLVDRLLDATVARFHRDLAPDRVTTQARFATTIPRSVGLGGSSAIVIATLRALCELHRVTLTRDTMAALALSIEVDDLGIDPHLRQLGGGIQRQGRGRELRHRMQSRWCCGIPAASFLMSARDSVQRSHRKGWRGGRAK